MAGDRARVQAMATWAGVAPRSGCRRSRPDVVRHHRGSGAVLSHRPSTAPAREGNVIAKTAITTTRASVSHPGDRRWQLRRPTRTMRRRLSARCWSTSEPGRCDAGCPAVPAWSHNPWLCRLVQACLATGDAVAGLVDDAALAWRSDQQIRFLVENLIEAIS